MEASTEQRGEFALGWKVLFASVLGVACGASPLPFNVIGFTVEPLIVEYGWTRTQILMPITIFGIIASLLAPFFGSLADKYGVRKVALYSLAAFGISFAMISLTPTAQVTSTLYIYYALWVLVGLVGIGSTPVSWSRAINLWFYKHRGLALGILLMGTSLAAITVPKLAVWAIENYGWRSMFAIVAILPLAVALPLGYFLFREPRADERPKAIAGASGNLTGVTLREAVKDYRFWLIWISIAIVAFSFGGAFINLPTMLSDRGLDAQTAASVMGVLGIGIFTGRIITGMLLDRFWAGFVAFPLLCLPAISCYILLGQDIAFPMAALAGFLLGFAAGAESDLIAYLTGRYFGMAHYGKIYGMLYMPFGFFSALSPIVYANVRDTSGSYDPILSVALFAFFIGGALLMLLGRYPDSLPEAEAATTEKLVRKAI
ncbi:MFS transporter [Sphingorhabdus sp. SMR4y]|uniref:MFS transporter n=1 Tax=Sphingorhabdus sp. SMR4y TaxID=2584094 RepID=UPI000B5CD43A|nr:MFS transporter [Sphingorhabdus sp. SMR4y]ASK88869.1 putative metabolite transport protein YjhB [Sphingorhabdus sp. SMR4y]